MESLVLGSGEMMAVDRPLREGRADSNRGIWWAYVRVLCGLTLIIFLFQKKKKYSAGTIQG